MHACGQGYKDPPTHTYMICVHMDILYLSNEPWLAEKQQHKKKQVDVIQSDPLSIMCFDQYQTC